MKYLVLFILFLSINGCSDDSNSSGPKKISNGTYKGACESNLSFSRFIKVKFSDDSFTANYKNYITSNCSGTGDEDTDTTTVDFEYSGVNLGGGVSYLLTTSEDSSGNEINRKSLFYVEGSKVYFGDFVDVDALTDEQIKENFADFIESPKEEYDEVYTKVN